MDLKDPYLTEQIITYLGNKRSLLKPINDAIEEVKTKLHKKKLVSADLFSGSGVVSRLLKQHSSLIIANDLEHYSEVLNKCFLANKDEFDEEQYKIYLDKINSAIEANPITNGVISTNYAPKNTNKIKTGERCFYTRENAVYIDSFRYYIDEIVPENLKAFFLAELLVEASIRSNTCGVFKGFYKDAKTGIGKFGGTAANALSRITVPVDVKVPVLSKVSSKYEVHREDAIELSSKLKNLDLVYLDPPYNQHPYGSNYFMLNVILDNKLTGKISDVAGIQEGWNHSPFNSEHSALVSLETIIENLKAKYVLISYNNEGFVKYDEMVSMLAKYGTFTTTEIKYNTFRGSRNLRGREIYTKEYLFLLKKVKSKGEDN